MNNLWSKEFELEKYWDKVMANPALIAEYNAEFEKHKAYFKLNSYEFNGTTIDIGGGAFGGVFNFLPIKGRKILADPLAYEFKERYNKIPAGVEIINAYCKDIDLPNNIADTIFCINTLDHCNNIEDFEASIVNIERMLKNSGLLFFMLPIRESQSEGHFIYHGNISRYTIDKYFQNYNIILKDWDYHCFYLVGKKK
ncbi:MAG: Methyltransferase domain protein [Parcubacteria group bacterium ADurb.Bin216]|nr:MAG: Methyltransferase domain protein [Parcubacteria group bacterium ADurb.Bin216]